MHKENGSGIISLAGFGLLYIVGVLDFLLLGVAMKPLGCFIINF